ncbi:hypothetical protein ACFL6R_07200 [Gemmatimonadota bacterium]
MKRSTGRQEMQRRSRLIEIGEGSIPAVVRRGYHEKMEGYRNMTGKRLLRSGAAGTAIIAVVVALSVPAFGQQVHDKAGTTSVPLLNLGFGPTGTALAEGLTAWSGSPDAVWWNPAAATRLASGTGSLLALGGARLYDGMNNTSLAWGTRLRGAGLVFLASYSGLTGIEVRDDLPTPDPLSTTSAHDLTAGVSVGLPFMSGDIGFAIKGIYEKLHYTDAWGVAIDAGIQLPLPGDLLRVGASVRNLGRMGVLDQVRLQLPWSVAIGAALIEPLEVGSWWLSAGADFWKPADDWAQLRLGVEASSDPLRLRIGTRQGRGWKTISAGLGIVFGGWQFDYAYVYDPDPDRRFIGSIQRLGIQIQLDDRNRSGR